MPCFFDAVDFGGDEQAVPVDELGGVGVVDDVDGDGLAFLHAQDGAGGCAVVADGGEDAVGGELDGDGRDAEGDVGFGGVGGLRGAEHLHLGFGGRAPTHRRRDRDEWGTEWRRCLV